MKSQVSKFKNQSKIQKKINAGKPNKVVLMNHAKFQNF